MKSTAKQENKFNFKRNIYIPKMSVDPSPVGSTTSSFGLENFGLGIVINCHRQMKTHARKTKSCN